MEPKYSLGQSVWFVMNNVVQNLPIVGIFRGLNHKGLYFRYGFDFGRGNYEMYDVEDLNDDDWVWEEDIFLSKEDLIKSL